MELVLIPLKFQMKAELLAVVGVSVQTGLLHDQLVVLCSKHGRLNKFKVYLSLK